MSDESRSGHPLAGLEGLRSEAAHERLQRWGPNAVPEERPHPLRLILGKFWGPVPWMLEITLALQLGLGHHTEGVVILVLLLLNAAVSFAQEGRARNAVALLRRRLQVQARAHRDGRWQLVPARDLVPDDLVHVRVGDLVPADLRIVDGHVLLDQSALTGESLPVEVGPSAAAYAGSVVQRGEASARVTATGRHTYFGKTAELVHAARTPSHLETVILRIVRYLVALDVLLVAAILLYALVRHLLLADVLPFALILLIASVPVALPATYTLATALGSLELAGRGVLVTRLSAIEEAAAMDVLCSDKTGTLTENRLTLAALRPYPPHSEDDLLRLAALASDEATQDPIDLALLRPAGERGLLRVRPRLEQFLPFDPATKRSEAHLRDGERELHVIKGAPAAIAALALECPDVEAEVKELAGKGGRVLAVAAGPPGALRLAGLVALHDPLRPDSVAVVRRLHELGVHVRLLTGDSADTARAVAAEVGIGTRTCLAEELGKDAAAALECDVFAGIFPEDKYRLIVALQRAGHVAGMTGDGVNDAPALKQAEVGIAVASATDVAKAAASLVLTRPGLGEVPAAVETGRRIYQRMLTYTLNKIVKTFQIALFLSLGLILTGEFVTTPLLVLLLLFANDFVTMSLAADRVSFSPRPDRWQVRPLVIAALALAAAWLLFSFATFLVGQNLLGLEERPLQTLVFVMLVFTGQANVYLVRERRHLWRSPPGGWIVVSSIADIAVVSLLATAGILMAPIRPALVAGLFALLIVYLLALDWVKVRLFRRFGL